MHQGSKAVLHLTNDPIISKSQNESLARVFRNVREQHFSAGEVIFRAHDTADHLYLIEHGSIELHTPEGRKIPVAGTRFGEEAATDVPTYLAHAVALTDVVVFSIPRRSLIALHQSNPQHKAEFYFSLLATFGGEKVKRAVQAQHAPPASKRRDYLEVFGWLLAILLPTLIMFLGGEWGITREVRAFLAIFSAAIVMWVFELVDEFIPGIFVVLLTLALGLAPTKVVLSGFASDGFFMAMSILGLGTVVVLSGLSFRCLLWLLRYLPSNKVGHNLGLFLAGFLLNPIIPSINARTVLMAPFLVDMVDTVKFQFRGRAATQLAITAFTGATLLSAAFLTSRSINFVLFGMLSPQEQQHFSWAYWLFASAVTGLVMLTLYVMAVAFIFRSDEQSKLSKPQIETQLQLLGKIKRREWAAIICVLIFSVGIATISLHNIQPPWMAMSVLFGLLLFGFLNKSEFREKTDWPSLLYLGALVGVLNTFNYLELDHWMTAQLSVLGDVLHQSIYGFVTLLFVLVMGIRLLIPNTATIAICATIFMPIASQVGVSPWVIGFILLLFGDMWLFPYQCPHYQQFQELVRDKGIYETGVFLKFNVLMNFVRLAGVYAAIPFWKALGLL